MAAADSLLQSGKWTTKMHATFRDVVIFVRDTGMRNKKELFRARIEDIDWTNRVFFIPDSKTANGEDSFQSVTVFWNYGRCAAGNAARVGSFPPSPLCDI